MPEFRRENILHQLVKARDVIPHKYNLLKLSKDNVKQVLGETFQPIVEPLEKFVANQSKEAVSRAVKHAEKSIKRDEKHNKSIKREEEYGDDDMQDEVCVARKWSSTEESPYRQRKGILQQEFSNSHDEVQDKSLLDVQQSQSLDMRTLQSNVEK